MKNLPIILLLGALFYLIYEGKSGMSKKSERVAPEAQNSFEQGVPAEYSPKDVHQFSTVEKLEQDLHFRRMKMKEQMKYEADELRKLGDETAYFKLLKEHKELYEGLKTSHKEMREQYLLRKEEDAARNSNLR